MSKALSVISAFILIVSMSVALAAESKNLPTYNDWQTCGEEAISEKAFKQVCLDDSIPPRHMVAEFRLKDKTFKDAELLIWTEFLRPDTANPDAVRMVNKFYFRSEEPDWQGPIDTTIFDISTLPTGEKTPLFGDDSRFGQMFKEFQAHAGVDEDNVEVPFVVNNKQNLLQVCPEAWIDDQMPMTIDPGTENIPRQYFILGGKRRELAEFDMEWVGEHCDIQPQVVH